MKLPAINFRVKQLIGHYAKGRVLRFTKALEYSSPARLNRLFNVDARSGDYPTPSTDVILDILRKYPEVSPAWLLLGHGTMFIDEGDPIESLNLANVVDFILLQEDELMKDKRYRLWRKNLEMCVEHRLLSDIARRR